MVLETLPDLRIGRGAAATMIVGHPWRYKKSHTLRQGGGPLLYLCKENQRHTLFFYIERSKAAHIYMGDLDDFRRKFRETVFTSPAGRAVTLGGVLERVEAPLGGSWTGF